MIAAINGLVSAYYLTERKHFLFFSRALLLARPCRVASRIIFLLLLLTRGGRPDYDELPAAGSHSTEPIHGSAPSDGHLRTRRALLGGDGDGQDISPSPTYAFSTSTDAHSSHAAAPTTGFRFARDDSMFAVAVDRLVNGRNRDYTHMAYNDSTRSNTHNTIATCCHSFPHQPAAPPVLALHSTSVPTLDQPEPSAASVARRLSINKAAYQQHKLSCHTSDVTMTVQTRGSTDMAMTAVCVGSTPAHDVLMIDTYTYKRVADNAALQSTRNT